MDAVALPLAPRPPAPAPSPVSHLYLDGDALLRLTWHEPPGGSLPEAVVQDLWARQALRGPLRTTDGRPLAVVAPGRLNRDGGPDFRAARLRLGDDLVAGDVEVHVTSGLWHGHGHDADARYGGVVLHVTLHADGHTGALRRADGSRLPEVVLAPHVDGALGARLRRFFAAPDPALPCAWGFPALPEADLRAWLRTLARLRLRRRARTLGPLTLADGPNDSGSDVLGSDGLDTALYVRLARTLGYRANADAFETLARRVPSVLLASLPDGRDREALLLGAAGLLPAPDACAETARLYAADLAVRFARLAPRLAGPPLPAALWQRGGLRPAATPELRLVQLAALAAPGGLVAPGAAKALADGLAEPGAWPRLRAALQGEPGVFWRAHYHFGRAAAPHAAGLGAPTMAALVANAVLPVALAAGGSEAAALGLLDALPAEHDHVTARYALPRAVRRSALTTQALHELSEGFCAPQRCLECPTGKALLRAAPSPA